MFSLPPIRRRRLHPSRRCFFIRQFHLHRKFQMDLPNHQLGYRPLFLRKSQQRLRLRYPVISQLPILQKRPPLNLPNCHFCCLIFLQTYHLRYRPQELLLKHRLCPTVLLPAKHPLNFHLRHLHRSLYQVIQRLHHFRQPALTHRSYLRSLVLQSVLLFLYHRVVRLLCHFLPLLRSILPLIQLTHRYRRILFPQRLMFLLLHRHELRQVLLSLLPHQLQKILQSSPLRSPAYTAL